LISFGILECSGEKYQWNIGGIFSCFDKPDRYEIMRPPILILRIGWNKLVHEQVTDTDAESDCDWRWS